MYGNALFNKFTLKSLRINHLIQFHMPQYSAKRLVDLLNLTNKKRGYSGQSGYQNSNNPENGAMNRIYASPTW